MKFVDCTVTTLQAKAYLLKLTVSDVTKVCNVGILVMRDWITRSQQYGLNTVNTID